MDKKNENMEDGKNASAPINEDALMTFANALSTVQKQRMKALNTKGMQDVASCMKNISATQNIAKSVAASCIYNSLGRDYLKSFKDIVGVNTIASSYVDNIAKLNFDGIVKLLQSIDSPMTKAVRTSLITMNYGRIIETLNETLKKNVLMASDMSFLKTTKLMDTFKRGIRYPSGFAAALKTINASTAKLIANNIDLEFDLDKKRFVSRIKSLDGNRPTATAKEMNIICSAAETFDSMKKISKENAEYNENETKEDEFIEEIELMDFMDYLFKTPTLGSTHSAGKKIMEVIRNIWKSSSSTNKIGFDKNFYYHSRARYSNVAPYVSAQMLKAPVGITGPGRYNHPGRSHYYFANTKHGSIEEVRKHLKIEQEIQTIKIKPVKPIVILDLSNKMRKGSVFLKYLRYPIDSITDKMPREYLIPCFVSDCCQIVGFEGVKYYGSKSYSNYVCWNDGYFEIEGNIK